MTKYLITFPADAMPFTGEALQRAADDSRAVVAEAKAAGAWVFGGAIDESADVALVATDGTVTHGGYPRSRPLTGGFAVFELPTRAAALDWAAKLAVACGCPQEVRAFHDDPDS